MWGMWICVVCVCETVWRGECGAGGVVFCVLGSLGVIVGQVELCCVCGTVCGGECGAGGVVLCVWDSLWGECGAGGVVLCVWGSLGERMSGR